MATTARHGLRPRKAFRNVTIYFALLVPAAAFGFAKTYLNGVTFSGKSLTPLLQIHTALMSLWLLMLAAQAWFIRTRRLEFHRWVGRSSYVVAPAVAVSTLVATHENVTREPAGITMDVARLEIFTWGQALAFVAAWGLAMFYRKRTPLHVRYMVSTTFAIGSAIVARIFINWIPGFGTTDRALAGNAVVLLGGLLGLIAIDWRRGMKRSPYWVVFGIIAVMHLGYWTFAATEPWLAFVQWFADALSPAAPSAVPCKAHSPRAARGRTYGLTAFWTQCVPVSN